MDIIRVGIDIGSTTTKLVALNKQNRLIFYRYSRHLSQIRSSLVEIVKDAFMVFGTRPVAISVTGSGGMLIAGAFGVDYVQEVIAQIKALQSYIPSTDVAIELGGEDAKIVYLSGGQEQRMNGTCAGGTGSFIDQMASLLQTDAQGLNTLAMDAQTIYPIASRCGVFAKTDIQPLINEGARKEDIAASIFQSVVTQTISGLACGRPIRGNVAFLGGPLNYLSQLRTRFIKTLALKPEQVLFTQNAHLFVACGAAMLAPSAPLFCFQKLLDTLQKPNGLGFMELKKLPPLFNDEKQYHAFRLRHGKNTVSKGELQSYRGNAFLGMDAGSTTTKAVLMAEDGRVLEVWYGTNHADPVVCALDILKDMYKRLPVGIKIANSGVTGYGEDLIKAALRIDLGEIETIAHYRAAKEFLPDVDFILDIGGQDMKCLRIRNGVIDTILLNEACSSGCGSFLETLASQLGLTVEEFARKAIQSRQPVDLGSRCTVFMNSRIKQAQKEGAGVQDISAGLAYSVVKNALYKVIKIRKPEDMGKNIMTQGGTFLNDAVLRAFENISGCRCIRPDIAALMGAYGMALIARERNIGLSNLLTMQEANNLSIRKTSYRCSGCTNQCPITVNYFDDRRYLSGNRCEKGGGSGNTSKGMPNLFRMKYRRLFNHYVSCSKEKARYGTVGLPRVLNMYENTPFWFTFFTELGFRVVLSGESNQVMYGKGMESIPSESVCYPAKLAHGHIVDLIEKKVDFIFMPCIEKECKEDKDADQSFNCPIVMGYPQVIDNNIESLNTGGIRSVNPFIPYHQHRKLVGRLYDLFKGFGISYAEVRDAVNLARKEDRIFHRDIQKEGEKALRWMDENNRMGIVLAGRPYHVDPGINHGIPELVASYGLAVFTEDSIAHLGKPRRPLRVRDQWMFHTRLYHAADVVNNHPRLQLVQLNSFGCGIDAVTVDQVQEILEAAGKIHTVLKIDEVSHLGAAKIRIRSLLAAMRERAGSPERTVSFHDTALVPFAREMRKQHTILVPQMSPIHFEFFEQVFQSEGYDVKVLPEVNQDTVEEGLKYVNNDACYPSILVVGQLIQALKQKLYEPTKTSVMMFQTGGGCRASNYIAFIRKALREAGFAKVPVISLNTMGFEKQKGFRLTPFLLNKALQAILYGDLLMRVLYATRPYEVVKGSCHALYREWSKRCKAALAKGGWMEFRDNIRRIIDDFDNIPIFYIPKPKVGVVGEILVKYHPAANNHLVAYLESEGFEVVVPDLAGFLLYCLYNGIARWKYGSAHTGTYLLRRIAISGLEQYRKHLFRALEKSRRFHPPKTIYELAGFTEGILSTGNCMGEGWLLTAEMVGLIKEGVGNIVCVQPFACLPNHVVGKGMIKKIRHRYPESNIVAVDYDPGASEVNQLNRIKLMLSIAVENQKSLEREPVPYSKKGRDQSII